MKNDEVLRLKKENQQLVDALLFYADPMTYFAIGFFPDPPNGDFMNDFSHYFMNDFSHCGNQLGYKPGKKAREILSSLYTFVEVECIEEETDV